MKGTANGLWMRRTEDAYDGVDDATHRERARSDYKAGDTYISERPRADHAHCAFGTPVIAARQRDREEAGVTPFSNRDLRYIAVTVTIVVAIIICAKLLLG